MGDRKFCTKLNSKLYPVMEFVKDSVFNHKFPSETDIIDIKKYFEDYGKLLIPFESCQNDKCKAKAELGCEEDNCKNDEFYIKFLGISRNELKELKERTDVNHLTCPGEIEPVSHDYYKKFNEENIKRKPNSDKTEEADTLISVKRRAEISDVSKIDFPRMFFKYCNYQWCLSNEKSSRSKLEFCSNDFSSVVACVKVYHPFLSSRNSALKVKLLQEIHILGDQTLSQLRDKIICSFDFIGDKDVSMECFLKDVGLNVTAKDEYPSSFIFIENTFYNDTRTPELIDLSKEIREWGSVRDLGPFNCKSMENTKICDVNLKIGRPYVFQHQGNCEHIIMFSDIRFLELSDPSKLHSYPRTHCTGRLYGKHCMMCADSYARWLVVGNERLTHDKTYLCKKCFLSYNYISGKKIGQFEAYKYVDPVALL